MLSLPLSPSLSLPLSRVPVVGVAIHLAKVVL